jgi:PAS domain S-box-containing protein
LRATSPSVRLNAFDFPNGRSLRAQSGSFSERAENAFEVSAVCRAQAGLRKDGSTFPVQVSLTPVATAAGQFALAVIRDITGLPRLVPSGDDR